MRSRQFVNLAALVLGIMVAHSSASGQTVTTIAPPSWWVEPHEQSLMLLIEGTNLDGALVRVTRGPIRVGRIETGREGCSLFVELIVPGGARSGRCQIEIEAKGHAFTKEWVLVDRSARRPEPFGPEDVIYLVMVDRFANGNRENDDPPGKDRLFDRRDTHAYHGGDFAGLRRRLPYLADLGITAIWLTPVYRPSETWLAANVGGTPRNMADFHGYCPIDFYDTNPRFGSLDEYRAMVDEAHRLGLKVIQDQILGYTGPKHRWVTHPPTFDWFHGPLERPPACNFRFDALTDPHARETERLGLTDGWFFGILPDLNVRDPRVSRYAIQQSLWWVTMFEADGVRLDTYPMVDRTFWRDWSRRLKTTHPGIRTVGEAWIVDASDLSFFQGGRPGWDGVDPGVDTVFDFPLNQAAVAVFSGRAPASALAQALRRDGLYPRSDLLVTFLDNHDTERFAGLRDMTDERLRLAVAFLLTTRGIPQITWGDEIGMSGHMDDRRDFPGGFPDDPRDAFTTIGRTPREQAIFATYRELLRLRKASPALRRGSLIDQIADGSIYVYLRQHGSDRAVVALNVGKAPADVPLPAEVVGPLESLYGEAQCFEAPGGARLRVPGESAAIFRVTGH
jgi:glycosidase